MEPNKSISEHYKFVKPISANNDHNSSPDIYRDITYTHDSIAQLDGAGDLSPLPSPSYEISKSTRALPEPSESANIRLAPYKLNQKKQLNKLKQDALKNDFEVSVSPTEQSVSVLCSTGFYSLVAVPSFASIKVGFKDIIAGVTIYCYDITGNIDDIGANINAVIFFRLSNHHQASIGGVTVHLHHTVRKIQVQGCSMVNNQVRASVWFMDNFLLDKFNTLSQNKAFNISKFNTAVNSIVTNHIEKNNAKEKCDICSGHFNGRSVRDKCLICMKIFHKRCILSPEHPCNRTLTPIQMSSYNPALSSTNIPADKN